MNAGACFKANPPVADILAAAATSIARLPSLGATRVQNDSHFSGLAPGVRGQRPHNSRVSNGDPGRASLERRCAGRLLEGAVGTTTFGSWTSGIMGRQAFCDVWKLGGGV